MLMFNARHKPAPRLKGYDYSQDGLYFITITTERFVSYFGKVQKGKMILNPIGKIVQGEWLRTSLLRSHVKLHDFQVMPNHFHAIIEIHELPLPGTEKFSPVKISPYFKNKFGGSISRNLFAIVRGFKSSVRATINSIQDKFVFEWHESFLDHVIRDDKEYQRIVNHIRTNPKNWYKDPNNPKSPSFKGRPSVY